MATDAISADNLYAFGVKHVTKGLGRITEGIMTKGEGSYVVYDDGRRMLDFTCGIGVTNLGGLLFLGDGFMLWRFPGGWASNASKLWDTPSTPHPLAKPPWPIYTPARFDDKREGHPTIFGPRLQKKSPIFAALCQVLQTFAFDTTSWEHLLTILLRICRTRESQS